MNRYLTCLTIMYELIIGVLLDRGRKIQQNNSCLQLRHLMVLLDCGTLIMVHVYQCYHDIENQFIQCHSRHLGTIWLVGHWQDRCIYGEYATGNTSRISREKEIYLRLHGIWKKLGLQHVFHPM